MFVLCSEFGYQHLTVNHSKNFKNPTTGACTNTCEGGWDHSKRDMVLGTRKKEGFSAHLAVQMLRKRLKAAEAAGGHDIVVGFFKEANKYMSNRKKELELEYLDSDSDPDSEADSDADFEMDHDMDSDSDVDMPPQEYVVPRSWVRFPPRMIR